MEHKEAQTEKTITVLNYQGQFECAKFLFDSDKFDDAAKMLDILVQHDESNFDAYFLLSQCYSKLGQHEQALSDSNKAIKLQPSSEAYFNRGNIQLSFEHYDSAIQDYNSAIELDKDSNAYFKRATAYLSLENLKGALESYNEAILDKPNFRDDEEIINTCLKAGNLAIHLKKYDKAQEFIDLAFECSPNEEQTHKQLYLKNIENADKLDKANRQLEKKNKLLEQEIIEKQVAEKALHEKEKEMLSFFTHTMRNALSTAPESLRQAIRLLGSEDYETDKKHYKAINKIAALFSTLSLTDCLIDTFKQSISEPEEFQRAWRNDNSGDATPKWVIASALRQSLNRIIFMSDTSELRQLLNNADTPAIIATRKSFIENILPLNIDNQGVDSFYSWLNQIDTLEISIEENNGLHFGVNQVKFSLLFAITSELLLNALKYWDGTGKIQVSWQLEQEYFIFRVTNPCLTNASSNLAGTHKGLAFIKRLIELLGEQASFAPIAEEDSFTAEFKLHQSLLEDKA